MNPLEANVPTARIMLGAAAFLAFALSVVLYFSGDEAAGIFVGIWVPSILALGAFVAPRRVQPAAARGGRKR